MANQEGTRTRPRGAYVRTSNKRCVQRRTHGNEGRGCKPRSWRGAHTYTPIIRGANGGAYGSREEGIYGLPSSFEVAKSSPPGSLPNTCKVLCLGLWRLGDLDLQT
jgi:hypothetical protein